MLKFQRFLLVLLSICAFSAITKADPIRIVTGTVTKDRINIQGQNSTTFDISSTSLIETLTNPRFQAAPGSNITPIVDAFGGYDSNSTFGYRGNTTISGIQFAPNNSFFGGGFGDGNELIFTPTQSFQLPVAPKSGAGTFSVQVPFTLQGYLSGISCPNGLNGPGNCSSIPGTSVYGNGIATFTYSYIEPRSAWGLSQYSYSFSTPEPTPEPATILLLGTGLAGIVGYARKKKRSKTPSN